MTTVVADRVVESRVLRQRPGLRSAGQDSTGMTAEQFLAGLDAGDQRLARGKYQTEDEMWALIDRLEARIHEHYAK